MIHNVSIPHWELKCTFTFNATVKITKTTSWNRPPPLNLYSHPVKPTVTKFKQTAKQFVAEKGFPLFMWLIYYLRSKTILLFRNDCANRKDKYLINSIWDWVDLKGIGNINYRAKYIYIIIRVGGLGVEGGEFVALTCSYNLHCPWMFGHQRLIRSQKARHVIKSKKDTGLL